MLDLFDYATAKNWDKEGDPAWRPSVYGLLERDGKVLMLKDGRTPQGRWELPGGGMEIGEDVDEALMREFKEETGYDVRVGRPLSAASHVFRNKRGMFQSVAIVLSVTLAHEEQDLSGMDQDEWAQEVAELDWVVPGELERDTISNWFHEALGL